MAELPFRDISQLPEEYRAATALARLVDGIGFRYHWATAGLCDEDLEFRPGPESMTLGKLLQHLRGLVGFSATFFPVDVPPPATGEGVEAMRRDTLAALMALRAAVAAMDDADLGSGAGGSSPWNAVNGPLADALTHIGQVNAWRRLAGNPSTPPQFPRGLPPKSK